MYELSVIQKRDWVATSILEERITGKWGGWGGEHKERE